MSFIDDIKMKYSIVSTSAEATLADNLTKELQSRIDAGERFKKLLEWENEDEERWDVSDDDFCVNYISLLLDRNPLEWKNGRIVLWRGVKLKDIDQLNLDKLGVCWSYVTEGAKSYDHPNQMKDDDYIIEAEAPVSAIDYQRQADRYRGHG